MLSKGVVLKGDKRAEIVTADLGKPTATQVLIRTHAVGLCGSDISLYHGSYAGPKNYPLYFGHEWSGIVDAVGPDVTKFKPGDKVTGECVIPCGTCYQCKSALPASACQNMGEVGFMPSRPGGMEEYLVLEEQFLHKLPDNMSYEEGALVETFTVSFCTMG